MYTLYLPLGVKNTFGSNKKIDFEMDKKDYIINGIKTHHNVNMSDYTMYNYHILQDTIVVTLFEQKDIL